MVPLLAGPTNTDEPDPAVARFLISLAVCNTVVPQVLEDGRFVYQVGAGTAAIRAAINLPEHVVDGPGR